MIRLIPPVAVPLGMRDVAATVLRSGPETENGLERRLAMSIGMRRAVLYGSGRAALAVYLQRIRVEGRDEVVVPAYTCWSVPAAVVRAGLKVRLVDIDPQRLDIDPESLARALGPRTLAVVAAHLFGPSVDLQRLVAQVKTSDPRIHVIEDAAQAWPERVLPQIDAVILSFGRGKPIPLGGGGALLVNSDESDEHDEGGRGGDVRPGGWGRAVSLAATSVLTHPIWYRVPESLPFLAVGVTRYDPEFELDRPFRRWQSRLASNFLDRLPQLFGQRTDNARRLAERLERLQGVTLPRPAGLPGPIRMPVLVASRALRDRMIPRLRARGVSATAMYPGTLAEIEALRPHRVADDPSPGADEVAARLLTLPVYPGLTPADLCAIADAFESALEEAGE